MIDQSVLEEVLGVAMRTGGEFAEVFAEEATGLEAVEVLIYRLRKKFELAFAIPAAQPEVAITTFRGMGYMLTLPAGQPV